MFEKCFLEDILKKKRKKKENQIAFFSPIVSHYASVKNSLEKVSHLKPWLLPARTFGLCTAWE